MTNDNAYKGSCFCGDVEFTVSGKPVAMGYCHCDSCRSWSGGPVNAYSMWKSDAITVTKGADNIGSYAKAGSNFRKWCKTCGGHFFCEIPGIGLTDVFASAIPDFKHEPSAHVNYQETVLRMYDGLPKLKDFPAAMGGSGDLLPE